MVCPYPVQKRWKTPDGWIFQSEHSKLSNLYQCKVTYEGDEYDSSERAFTAKMCKVSKQPHVLKKVLEAKTPRDCMYAAKQCVKTQEWVDMDEQVMMDVNISKFSVPELQTYLLSLEGHLYEGTKDPKWGCNYHLGQKDEVTQVNVDSEDSNKLGQILETIRDNIKDKPETP